MHFRKDLRSTAVIPYLQNKILKAFTSLTKPHFCKISSKKKKKQLLLPEFKLYLNTSFFKIKPAIK